jgi:hypothetical protein
VQCSSVPINNRVFVIKSFKMTNFTNVELTNMIPAGYGAGVATRSNHKYCTGNRIVILFIVGDTDNLTGKRILSNCLNDEEYLRFLSDTLPELLDEVSMMIA